MSRKKTKSRKKQESRHENKSIAEIKFSFIPFDAFADKSSEEKIKMIVEKTKENVILILEGALTPEEEVTLIQEALSNVDTESYFGVEFISMYSQSNSLRERIANMIAGKRSGITLIGPKKIIEEMKREQNYILLFAKSLEESKEEERKRRAG